MHPKLYVFIFCLLFSISSFSQHETSKWFYGSHGGLDFMTNPPTPIPSPSMVAMEGCASIADGAGNLLFYTDGVTVWDKTHAVMSNGTGLMGDISTTQCLIVKRPGNNSEYYVFTVDDTGGPNGLRYTTVDMSLAGGNGSVTALNTLLHNSSAEKLAAVDHCNGQDIWLLSHDFSSNNFRAYRITATGVSTTAVLSPIGPTYNMNTGWSCQMKFSPNGRKLGLTNQFISTMSVVSSFELYDFDNATGVVSNFQNLGNNFGIGYGCEFSPDGTKFYGSLQTASQIYQWDLCANNATTVVQSQFTGAGNFFAALQLGPDGKIYVCRGSNPTLGVINNPNVAGAGMNYNDAGPTLVPFGNVQPGSGMGLPGFKASYFREPIAPAPFTYTSICENTFFTSAQTCTASGLTIQSVSWNFGEPASGAANTSTQADPQHTYLSPGTYTVMQVLHFPCSSDTLLSQVVIQPGGPALNLSGSFSLCNGQITTITASGSNTYSWSTQAVTPSITVSPTVTTSYTVTGYDPAFPCSTSSIITVSVNPLPSLGVSGPTLVCLGQKAIFTASGASTYTWSNGGSASTLTLTPASIGSYTVTGTSTAGCSAQKSFVLNVQNCTGVEELSSGRFSVYPNPFNNALSIETEKTTHLVIHNSIGALIFDSYFAPGKHSIDLRNYPTGVYLLRAADGQGSQVFRLVKTD